MLGPNAFVQNRYLFVRRLGGGERSAVYEAIDMTTRANVALKQVIVGADVNDARRASFEREAQRLVGLRHPALPALRGLFFEGDSLFLAAEFVPGDDLMAQVQRSGQPFPAAQVLRWADHLLDALDYLHSHLPSILHRDISPCNLKLTPRGQVMLLDFGLEQSEALPAQAKPAAGAVSPFQFMPPEQVARTGTTVRSDLFSLAATLYYLLTGTLPVLAGKRANAIARGQPDPLRPARELNPDLTQAVSDLLMSALALDPSARPVSAADMRAALNRAQVAPHAMPAERVGALAPTITTPAPSFARTARPAEDPTLPIGTATAEASQPRASRRWLLPAIGGAVLLVLLLAFVLLRGLGSAAGVVTASGPTLAPAVPTVAPRLATSAPEAPASAIPAQTDAPTQQPETVAEAPTHTPELALAQATKLDPTSAFIGELPITITVDGTNMDKVRVAQLVSGSGGIIPADMLTRVDSQIRLSIRALPEPIKGEANYALQLDGVVQKVSVITLRDYRERKPAQGVLADYSYTGRIASDEAGAYTSLLADAVPNSQAQGKLRNGDQVDVLRNDLADWYQVRIATSADASQAGLVGWVERWLIDNQNSPPAPTATPEPTAAVQVFVGRVYSTPTDAAAQCGAAFASSIYGSIENSSGKGIAGAVVRVTSADGRNSYTATTGRGGVYNIGGLGCTKWVVRLISVPKAKIQANTVTVGNLNGGRFTSAEVRFKLRG